jgi:hypothetical protein
VLFRWSILDSEARVSAGQRCLPFAVPEICMLLGHRLLTLHHIVVSAPCRMASPRTFRRATVSLILHWTPCAAFSPRAKTRCGRVCACDDVRGFGLCLVDIPTHALSSPAPLPSLPASLPPCPFPSPFTVPCQRTRPWLHPDSHQATEE